MTVYGKQADVDANAGRNVQLWTPDTKMTASDQFLGGSGTGVTDEMLNGAKRYAGATAQDTANIYGSNLNANNTPRYDASQAETGIKQSLSDASVAFMANQKAKLDSALSTQLTGLQIAYEQAISEGKISVRDAQASFTSQKTALEQQAYQAHEQTKLYSQNMGIQNSQQAVGLMQGDQARTATLNNANMTDRDRRIADIKDRLKSLGNQSKLSMVDAQAQHDYGLAGAQGQADMNYANGITSMQQSSLEAGRTQQNNLDLGAVQQKYAVDNMATQQNYTQLNMKQQQEYVVANMYTQNRFDVSKMQATFAHDFEAMAKQFGYSSQLQSQASANSARNASNSTADAMAQEEQKYQISLGRATAGMTPGTPEYNIKVQQMGEANRQAQAQLYNKGLAEANLAQYKAGPPTALPEKGWFQTQSSYDAQRRQYDSDNAKYQAISRAVNGGQ